MKQINNDYFPLISFHLEGKETAAIEVHKEDLVKLMQFMSDAFTKGEIRHELIINDIEK